MQNELSSLIKTGKDLKQRINQLSTQTALVSLARFFSQFDEALDEIFQTIDSTHKNIRIPQPILLFFKDYVNWFRECQEFFRYSDWLADERVKEFILLKTEMEKEVLRQPQKHEIVESTLSEQIQLLHFLKKNPPMTPTRFVSKRIRMWSLLMLILGLCITITVIIAVFWIGYYLPPEVINGFEAIGLVLALIGFLALVIEKIYEQVKREKL